MSFLNQLLRTAPSVEGFLLVAEGAEAEVEVEAEVEEEEAEAEGTST